MSLHTSQCWFSVWQIISTNFNLEKYWLIKMYVAFSLLWDNHFGMVSKYKLIIYCSLELCWMFRTICWSNQSILTNVNLTILTNVFMDIYLLLNTKSQNTKYLLLQVSETKLLVPCLMMAVHFAQAYHCLSDMRSQMREYIKQSLIKPEEHWMDKYANTSSDIKAIELMLW